MIRRAQVWGRPAIAGRGLLRRVGTMVVRGTSRRRVLAVVGVVAAVSVAGWLGTRWSGRGEAASDGADSAALVTAPVERRVLESLQVTRGSVIAPAQATVLAGSPSEGELAVVVTGVPLARGLEVAAGTVVVELNGRPVFALPGAIPVYRDLRPGDSGPDVEAVQGALQSLGYEIPETERSETSFGRHTQRAVEDLYEGSGYAGAYTLGSEDAVEHAEDQADGAVAAAQSALDTARAANSPDVSTLERAVDDAAAARDRVNSTEGVILPAREFVAVPVLPAMLVDLPVTAGQRVEAGSPVARIGSNQFQIRIDLTGAQVNGLAADVEIAVFSDDGYEATCPPTEPQSANAPETQGNDGGVPGGDRASGAASTGEDDAAQGDEAASQSGAHVMDVTCDPLPPPDALGASVRVTMTVRRSEGEVLVVPATGVTTTSSGEAFVEVVSADGQTTLVPVSVGGEADGFVEVTPLEEHGALDQGMDVRVRRR